ncbi:hypothetical protein FACS1894124_1760 [Spirochaetia bacterium]|nr:hypothetical protein FACS1894124_1760 [Spirochaetia bacterium]
MKRNKKGSGAFGKKAIMVGMLAAVLAFGLVLAGCDNGNGGGDDDGPLPGIKEETTGKETIAYSDISVSGIANASYANTSNGYTIAVSGGKLTLSLTTPTYTEPVSGFGSWLFGQDYSSWNNATNSAVYTNPFTASPANVNIAVQDSFAVDSNWTESVARYWEDTDGTTYQKSSQIVYVYVSGDVALTRAAIKRNGDHGDPDTNYAAISLSLKKGWNLVQVDSNYTASGGSVTVKIADKDIPWVKENLSGAPTGN